MVLSRQQILDVSDLSFEVINIPEWGGDVRIRMLTGSERDEFEASLFDDKSGKPKNDIKNLRSRLCSLCIVDDNNIRLFTDKDIDVLSKKSGKVLGQIFKAAQVLNGIGQTDVEDKLKNSQGGGGDISISPSPSD